LTESFEIESLLDEFRDEARDQVDRLDAGLLQFERAGDLDAEGRNALLRDLHTLKGNAGMLGLAAIRDFVHVLETALKSLDRAGVGAFMDRLFEGASALRTAVEAAGSEGEAPAFRELAAVRHRLEELDLEAPQGGGATAGTDETLTAPAADDRIRVPFSALDTLLSEVGELMGEADALLAAVSDASRSVAVERAAAVKRRTDRLREAAMTLRLVPLGRVFTRFHGLVRRLAREQGKEARLVVVGEATEVDKSTADALAEPLLHLVRNAIDHGIESPDRRESEGKPAYGTVRLAARQEGDRVRIEVEDDGAGMDLGAIRSRARAAGVIQDGGEPLSDAGVLDLVFQPGLSTREEVSAVSGRGVGLDVVRRRVRSLRGEVTAQRPEGGGTRLVMTLPLTVASVPSVVFEVGEETLAVPAAAVDRTLPLERIEQVGSTEMIRDGDRLLPLADPHRLFGWPTTDRGGFGLQIRAGRAGAVLSAHRLIEQRDLVVKAIPPYGVRPPGVSGASVVPGGRVILVLDPVEVIDLIGASRQERVP
jgi:two-component system, chemotaxis family, sensor kinase CheA